MVWLGWSPLPPRKVGILPNRWSAVSAVAELAQLTGPGSVNQTFGRWGVFGTDLGHSFRHRDSIYMVFGDTYGIDRSDWRSNVMARIDGTDPDRGKFAEMIVDRPGHAKELLSSRKIPILEQTVIPTGGTSVGGRMYLHYMSVRRFQAHGRWSINHAGLAFSDDDGATWIKSGPMWSSSSNFGQVTFEQRPGDDFLYLMGIPAGRYGGARLARVEPGSMLDPLAYRYWDGHSWSANEETAETLVPGPVGELSFTWHEGLGEWVMMYLNELLDAVVVRTATVLTGPWSEEQLLLGSGQAPGLYAPYLIPGDPYDPRLLFTVSRWDRYNVYLYEAVLQT
jgi:hypothetical protein